MNTLVKTENNAPLLSIKGLTKEFRQGKDRVMAVHDISLDIQKGEVFGLVGESGCGKSTFGQMLVHLLDPTSGTILLNGEDITRPRRRERKDLCKQMQIVFQDPYSSIDPNKTIGWLIEEPLRIHGIGKTQKERDEKVSRVLKAVGLDESYRTRWPNELSGGQRQRVAIAIALILDPSFVVCDEPVSALDVSVQAQVLNLLLDLRKEFGLTYLFISHDLNVVSYVSDRIGVMYLGNLVERARERTSPKCPCTPTPRHCSPPRWTWRATGNGSSSREICPARLIPRPDVPSTPGALPAPTAAKRKSPCCGSLRAAGFAPATWWRNAPACGL